MKHTKLILSITLIVAMAIGMQAQMYITKSGHAKFFSETVAENITANNYKMTSTLNATTGEMVFSVPIQSFEFEKSLMQKHFNQENYMDSKKHPKAKFKGKITNIDAVKFTISGSYNVEVKGELTIKGVTKSISEKGTISVQKGQINAKSTFYVLLADYGVGRPTNKKKTNNVAEKIKVDVDLNYKPKN